MARRRFATIDIGTNTILLLVVDLEENGAFRVVTDRAEIARLGEGVDRTRALSAAGMERGLEVLREYVHTCRTLGAKQITAIGTSALRDALNAKNFAARLRTELKLELRVLSGAEEAAYSYLAVQKGLQLDAKEMLVVDVGGGSTEFIWAKDGRLHGWASLDVGSVRLTERYLSSDPPTADECGRLTQAVDESLNKLPADWSGKISSRVLRQTQGDEPGRTDRGEPSRTARGEPSRTARGEPSRTIMVGIAGTFTTLAAVQKGLLHYSHSEVHGSRLSHAEVERQIELYRAKTVAARKEIAGLEPKRADVILAGTILIERIMRLFNIGAAIVSDQGIRYGLLYEKITKKRPAIGRQRSDS
jgi:exopolyphosphatase/guanosine-5'-triphosphate,3'-diphosphate pyrophosphatase